MNIIAGKARSIELLVPPGVGVRPTAGRSRKALFDSLGDFSGARIVDLFAGSGALGLESASRGASSVIFVERERSHARAIEANIEKVRKTGVECEFYLKCGDASNGSILVRAADGADVIFADPPYAMSADLFEKLLSQERFLQWAQDALLVWELPSIAGKPGRFLNRKEFASSRVRDYAGTKFLLGMFPSTEEEA